MDPTQERELRNRSANLKDLIQAWLTPFLLIIVGTMGVSQWNKITHAEALETAAQQKIMVQLATIEEQIHEGQESYSSMQGEIDTLQGNQRDHEHRITILESMLHHG